MHPAPSPTYAPRRGPLRRVARLVRLSALVLPLLVAGVASRTSRAEDAPLPLGLAKPGLDVGLVVGDLARMKAFYGETLGLKEAGPAMPMPGGGELHRYRAGETDVKLLSLPGGREIHKGGINEGIGMRLLTLFLSDLEGIASRAAAAGAAMPPILGQAGRGRLMFLFDPDGNQVEILELPSDPAGAEAGRRLFMVGLTVGDVEASRAFYGTVLGMKEQPPRPLFGASGPTKYTFGAGATSVKFWKFDKEIPVRAGRHDAAVGIRYLTFRVKDLDAALAELQGRGAKVVQPITTLGEKIRLFFIEDPDGNWIEFVERKG